MAFSEPITRTQAEQHAVAFASKLKPGEYIGASKADEKFYYDGILGVLTGRELAVAEEIALDMDPVYTAEPAVIVGVYRTARLLAGQPDRAAFDKAWEELEAARMMGGIGGSRYSRVVAVALSDDEPESADSPFRS